MKSKVLLFACCVAFVTAMFLSGCSKKSTITYVTSKAQKQDIKTTITATGTIEPVTQVEVGTQVSGIIAKIYVDYNSVVKKGQVIAELDKTNLVSELTSAQSNLANAQSNLTYQTANFNRYKTLYEKGLVSANDYESARLTFQQAQAAVKVQTQNVQKARTNLGYATITAPIDGVVLNRAVEEGQTVASSFSTPTLFTIAQDLTDMRVIANVDEADIGGIVDGQRVTFTVDAFPDDTFNGVVTQVRQEATTESNVVTYEVVISAPNNDLKLKPGLTANVTVYTLEKNNVLTIPSKALRFMPSDKLLSKDQSIEDCNSPQKVWKQEGNVFKAYPVKTGITNGVLTEIISGVKENDEILTEISATNIDEDENASQNKNPFMPGPRNRNKNQKSGSK
ncbi:MAG TPA: efflux RND transporter periplasmic adaptor subunit [Prevotellaceae bacterium]|jgi:HlyD family secretion protein|nr:efflux RND transporter periplasmic adaptor subunit [Prevotellaceae bacterium]